MDLFLKMLGLAAALLVLFDCSRPKKATVRRWSRYLIARLRQIRQPNDHRRAAVAIFLIDRRIGRFFKELTGTIFRPIGNNVPLAITLLAVVLLSPVVTPPRSFLGWGATLILAILTPFFVGCVSVFATAKWVDGGDKRVQRVFPKWWAWPFIVYGRLFGLRLTATPHGRILHFRLPWTAIICFVGLLAYLVKGLEFLEWAVSWPDWIFYTAFLSSGQITIILFLMLFVMGMAGLARQELNTGRVLSTLLYWSTSLTLLVIMAHTARTLGGFYQTASFIQLAVYFLSDVYTIFLFRRLVSGIIRTRRQGTRQQFVILGEYAAFFARTCVAGLIATYVATSVTRGSFFSFVEAWRVFIGISPTGAGWLDWPSAIMAHSMFIPLAIILAVPILMIIQRLIWFVIYVLGFNVVKNSNPLAYVSAVLALIGVSLDIVFDFSGRLMA
jgi:hypothetical protein